MRRAIGRVALVATLALSVLVVAQAPALAKWQSMADATLQVKKACVDGVVLDVGALSPRPLDSQPPSDLPPTQDVVVQATDPTSGQLVLNTTVTVPLNPTVIKLTTGERMIIDYSKRFTLQWNQELAVGQEVSLRAAAVGSVEFIDQVVPITTTVKNCRLFN
jgi:hypothetical protein